MDPISLAFGIALLVASYALTSSAAKTPPPAKPAAVTDFEFPQAAEGTPQCVIFGDCWTEDWVVLWYGNFIVDPIVSRTGGKK